MALRRASSRSRLVPTIRRLAVMDALAQADVDPSRLVQFLHGTTIATNALIERRGARCALLTTRGFRDVLELGRRDRPQVYGLSGKHEPLIPRDRRWEIDERIDYRGRVVTPLDEAGVRDLRSASASRRTSPTIVISFLHSYVNPAHEERVPRAAARGRPASGTP